MDYFVYILKGIPNWHYVGFTTNVDSRLAQHNGGQARSTKAHRPFGLFFVQVVNTKDKARDLEKFLKIRFNKEALIEIVSS